jgi:hypothetical protein
VDDHPRSGRQVLIDPGEELLVGVDAILFAIVHDTFSFLVFVVGGRELPHAAPLRRVRLSLGRSGQQPRFDEKKFEIDMGPYRTPSGRSGGTVDTLDGAILAYDVSVPRS